MAYRTTWKLRTGDTDYSGLVYTPRVIDRMVEIVQELMDLVGSTHNRRIDDGLLFPTVHTEADYVAPIGIGDVVEVEVRSVVETTSVRFEFLGTHEGEPVFEGEEVHVFMDDESKEAVPVPEHVRSGLAEYQE